MHSRFRTRPLPQPLSIPVEEIITICYILEKEVQMPLSYREAVRLIKQNGGFFFSHGSRHDLFLMPNGDKIAVPRHAGDFSPGVERDIRRRAERGGG